MVPPRAPGALHPSSDTTSSVTGVGARVVRTRAPFFVIFWDRAVAPLDSAQCATKAAKEQSQNAVVRSLQPLRSPLDDAHHPFHMLIVDQAAEVVVAAGEGGKGIFDPSGADTGLKVGVGV